VVGLPNEDGGEEVVAAVVLVEGVPVQPDELRAHTREGLTPYKVPRRVVFVDELPTNPMGKVLRREVASRIRES
jgi:long-chain acyl-CoA synthetase